jgi:limonene-1,2-epoxide hydrolase
MTPLDTVNAFMAAAAKRDYDTALPMLAEDVVYQNMPLPPVTGRQAVQDTLDALLGAATASEWTVLRELAGGDMVMNERLDWFEINGKRLELPVMGVFVLRDGLIAEWRDYFDLPTITSQMAEAGPTV